MSIKVKIISKKLLKNSTTIELVTTKPSEDFLQHEDILPGAGAILKIGDVSRPYSFASSPNSSAFNFLIRIVEDGEFNVCLSNLREGDDIEIEELFRYFNIENHPEAYYFATGTGIAPFLSALTARGYHNQPKAIFYGAKTNTDLVKKEILQTYAANSQIKYFTSKEPDSDGRYITEAIDENIISPTAKYYVCGLTDMTTDVSNKLIDLGVEHDQIAVELFYSKM